MTTNEYKWAGVKVTLIIYRQINYIPTAGESASVRATPLSFRTLKSFHQLLAWTELCLLPFNVTLGNRYRMVWMNPYLLWADDPFATAWCKWTFTCCGLTTPLLSHGVNDPLPVVGWWPLAIARCEWTSTCCGLTTPGVSHDVNEPLPVVGWRPLGYRSTTGYSCTFLPGTRIVEATREVVLDGKYKNGVVFLLVFTFLNLHWMPLTSTSGC